MPPTEIVGQSMEYVLECAVLPKNTQCYDTGREDSCVADGSKSFQRDNDLSAPQVHHEGYNGSSLHDHCKVPPLWSVVGKVEDGQAGNEVRD